MPPLKVYSVYSDDTAPFKEGKLCDIYSITCFQRGCDVTGCSDLCLLCLVTEPENSKQNQKQG